MQSVSVQFAPPRVYASPARVHAVAVMVPDAVYPGAHAIPLMLKPVGVLVPDTPEKS
jgi:hypothetical protein